MASAIPQPITINPRDWIMLPYDDCQHCATPNGVGLVMVSRDSALRRCRSCMRDYRVELPPSPQPRSLYLDQWALSNLAKALLPETRDRLASGDPAAGAGMWPRLLARIERLVKANLLVCPPSSVHRLESSLNTQLQGALRRLHLYLSGDARFVHHERVKREQLYMAFCAWVDDADPAPARREDVLKLRDGWPDPLQVASSYTLGPDELRAVRARRLTGRANMQQQVELWASQAGRPFAERQAEQLAAYGPGHMPLQPLSELWVLTRHAMEERSIASERWVGEVDRFMHSEAPKATEFARLASGLLAALGWLAERSQAQNVDAGTREDIQAFATYAPFCDAFTVDRRFAHLLRNTPMAEQLPRHLTVFATTELARLEDWLIATERTAPPGHFELVRDIYGDGWLQPYERLLEPPPAGETLRSSCESDPP